MKDFRIVRQHSVKCWFVDPEVTNGDGTRNPWYFDTWRGVHHESRERGFKRFVYADCNCPGCPARLRVNVDVLEDFVFTMEGSG